MTKILNKPQLKPTDYRLQNMTKILSPIVDNTKFQQGEENLIFFQIFDILYQNIIIRE